MDEDTTRRINKLERQNRVARALGVLLVLATAAVALMGQKPQPRRVVGEEFALTDARGRDRARLATLPDGSPSLTLLDERGITRLALGFVGAAPSVTLADESGRPRILVSASPDGTLSLALRDAAERTVRVALGVHPDGSASLALHNKAGRPQAELEVTPDDVADLVLTRKDGSIVWKAH